MSRSKKIFAAFAFAFFLFLLYIVYDMSNRTTFPGRKPAHQELPQVHVQPDSVSRKDTTQP